MRYIIVCAGENHFEDLYKHEENDFIISVDGGYNYLNKLNIMPDIHLGDNDSSINNNYKVKKEIIKYNPIKDDSDLELAINYILTNYNNEEVLVYNATGNRLDHYEANIRLLLKNPNVNIKLLDDKNKIYVLNNNIYNISKSDYKYISFFNYEDNTVISLEGFKYNLENYMMKKFDNLCLSNEIIGNGNIENENIGTGKVKVNKCILCIESKDK